MGEEKPDEELMGKRKSSPRLSTASLDADILRIASLAIDIHGCRIIFWMASSSSCLLARSLLCNVGRIRLTGSPHAAEYLIGYPFRSEDRV